MMLYEKYRPRTLGDIIGQEWAVEQARNYIKLGLLGRAIWVSGKSGHGKTSLARILAATVIPETGVLEFDARSFRQDYFEQITRDWSRVPFWGDGHVLILNEATHLRNDLITPFLNILESPQAQRALVIFTTTIEGTDLFEDEKQNGHMLLSRCNRIQLEQRLKNGVKPLSLRIAERAKEIAQAEGLDGKPIKDYLKLVQENENNFRAVLSRIEDGEMLK